MRPLLESEFPDISFIDPAELVAAEVAAMAGRPAPRNSLRVYASGDVRKFGEKLAMLGYRTSVTRLTP